MGHWKRKVGEMVTCQRKSYCSTPHPTSHTLNSFCFFVFFGCECESITLCLFSRLALSKAFIICQIPFPYYFFFQAKPFGMDWDPLTFPKNIVFGLFWVAGGVGGLPVLLRLSIACLTSTSLYPTWEFA